MANITTPHQAKEQFLLLGNPFFFIKGKKDVVLLRNEKDANIDSASDLLYNWLNNDQDTGEMLICTFATVPKGGITKHKIEDGSGFYYQNKRTYTDENKQDYWATKKSGLEMQLIDAFERMEQRIEQRYAEKERRLDEKLDALLELNEAEDDEKVAKSVETNYLGAILGNPQIMSLITGLITNLTANFVTQPKQPIQPIKPTAMAGTETQTEPQQAMEPNEEIAKLIAQLFDKGLTIDHLRKLASMPQIKIQSLLMML